MTPLRQRYLEDMGIRKTDELYLSWLTSDSIKKGTVSGSRSLPNRPDGRLHTYVFELALLPEWNSAGMITGIRLDPTHFPANIEVKSISLFRRSHRSSKLVK